MKHNKKPKYVLLQGLKYRNRFITPNGDRDPRFSKYGEKWYKIIGYAESISEAQRKLYGRVFPLQ